jgi:hypothetical protein
MMGYGERSQRTLLRVSGRVRDADLRVETAAELAFQSRPQACQAAPLACSARARSDSYFSIMTSRSRRLVRGVKLNAGFAVDPGDGGLECRDRLGAVLGDGKA